MTEKAAQQIASARAVTVKRWLNEPGSHVYAEEVVDNFANVGEACMLCKACINLVIFSSACCSETYCACVAVSDQLASNLIQPECSTCNSAVWLASCCMQAGTMDKFMRKIRPSAALKGAHLRDVRRHFKPTDLSYDSVEIHQTHKQRLLLKAEPQVGKTGV